MLNSDSGQKLDILNPIRSNVAISFLPYIIAAVYAGVISVYVQQNSQDAGGDFAQYLLHARAILAGQPYDYLNVGSVGVLPGFPLLLASFVSLFGYNFAAMQSIIYVFLALSFVFLFSIVTSRRSLQAALAIAAITLPLILTRMTTLAPDIAYLAVYNIFLASAFRLTMYRVGLARKSADELTGPDVAPAVIEEGTDSAGHPCRDNSENANSTESGSFRCSWCVPIIFAFSAIALSLMRPEAVVVLLPAAVLIKVGYQYRILLVICGISPILISRWLGSIGMQTYDGVTLGFFQQTVSREGFGVLLAKLEGAALQAVSALANAYGLGLPVSTISVWQSNIFLFAAAVGLTYLLVIAADVFVRRFGLFILDRFSFPEHISPRKSWRLSRFDSAAMENYFAFLVVVIAAQMAVVVVKAAEIGHLPPRYLLPTMSAVIVVVGLLTTHHRWMPNLGDANVDQGPTESMPIFQSGMDARRRSRGLLLVGVLFASIVLGGLRLPGVKQARDLYFNREDYRSASAAINSVAAGCSDLEVYFYKPRNLTLRLAIDGLDLQVRSRFGVSAAIPSAAQSNSLFVFHRGAPDRYGQDGLIQEISEQNSFASKEFGRFVIYVPDDSCAADLLSPL